MHSPGQKPAPMQRDEGVGHSSRVIGIHGEHLGHSVCRHWEVTSAWLVCRGHCGCCTSEHKRLRVCVQVFMCIADLPLPVKSCAHRFELTDNPPAILLMPLPDPMMIVMPNECVHACINVMDIVMCHSLIPRDSKHASVRYLFAPFEELLSSQCVSCVALPFAYQLLLHNHLRGNTRVVQSRYP